MKKASISIAVENNLYINQSGPIVLSTKLASIFEAQYYETTYNAIVIIRTIVISIKANSGQPGVLMRNANFCFEGEGESVL